MPQTLEYAVMRDIGSNGIGVQKTLDRLHNDDKQNITSSADYLVLLLQENFEIRSSNPVSQLLVGADEVSPEGRWKRWIRTDMYYSGFRKTNAGISQKDVDETRRVMLEYQRKSSSMPKTLAIVGYDNPYDYALKKEVAQQLSQKAVTIFLEASKGIFEPQLIYDKFRAEVPQISVLKLFLRIFKYNQ